MQRFTGVDVRPKKPEGRLIANALVIRRISPLCRKNILILSGPTRSLSAGLSRTVMDEKHRSSDPHRDIP